MSLTGGFNKVFNTFKTKIFTKFSNDNAKLLMMTGAAGWILASFSNMTGVFFNKKLDKKQKRYMAAQELADGFTNVALFIFITNRMIKTANKLVEKGVIGSKSLVDANGKKMLQAGVGTIASLTGSVLCNNVLTPIIRNKIATKVQKRNEKMGITRENNPIVNPSSMQNNPLNKSLSIYNYMAFTKGGGNLKI